MLIALHRLIYVCPVRTIEGILLNALTQAHTHRRNKPEALNQLKLSHIHRVRSHNANNNDFCTLEMLKCICVNRLFCRQSLCATHF